MWYSAEIRLWKQVLRRSWRRFRTLAALKILRAIGPKPLGARGEDAAARFLRRQGCRVVAHGYRDRLGEVDLVCVKDQRLVFVEVKTRRSENAGQPVEAVNPQKQRRVTAAAERFIRRHDLNGIPIQFDVISVVWPADAKKPQITHYSNAYQAIGA
jgi:putative endonuclease